METVMLLFGYCYLVLGALLMGKAAKLSATIIDPRQ